MPILVIKLITISICAVCKLVGELWWHNAQRYIMPVVLGIAISIVTGVWWLGFCVLPMIAPLVMGYKTYGKSDGFDRAVWLGLICVVAGLGTFLLHHLAWYFYLPYSLLGFVWGGVTRAWWNVIIAPISGIIIGSLIFLVR